MPIDPQLLSGTFLIENERKRQIEREGWSPEHDDQHKDQELVKAALCYAGFVESGESAVEPGDHFRTVPPAWPWDRGDWKPKDKLTDLVRAGALISAEVDRLIRLIPGWSEDDPFYVWVVDGGWLYAARTPDGPSPLAFDGPYRDRDEAISAAKQRLGIPEEEPDAG